MTITSLQSEQTGAAAQMLARAFVTNPLHVAVFGESQIKVNEAFFKLVLAATKGSKLVATEGARVVGLAHWVHSSGCQPSGAEKVRLMPTMVRRLGLRPTLRLMSWLSMWSKHDPAEPHCHLGPIGVEPDAQGRHIGSELMARYCSEVDQARVAGYLETDRPENVDFYKRFGFEVTATESIHGVTNFFMQRALQRR